MEWTDAVTFLKTYQGYGYAAAIGYTGAIVVPVADLAVTVFRLALKFPLVRMAVKKNPEAVKSTLDLIEKALDAEVDKVAAEDGPAAPKAPAA